jgi:hypothetical protein
VKAPQDYADNIHQPNHDPLFWGDGEQSAAFFHPALQSRGPNCFMLWFRLYHDLKDNPKVGRLPDSAFRTFVEAMCWASQVRSNGSTGVSQENADWAFRRNVTSDVTLLLQQRLLSVSREGVLFVTNWDSRQKRSDSSAERVKKHREKASFCDPVTLQKRTSNGAEESRGEKNRGESAFERKSTHPDLSQHGVTGMEHMPEQPF